MKQQIPSHWQNFTLEILGDISGGGTPSTKQPEYWDGNLQWLTPTEVTKNKRLFIQNTQRTITELGLRNSSAKLLPSGSVLMTSRATIGEVVINTVPITTNQGFINVICNENVVFNEFLAYWIKLNKHIFNERANGVTFREITKSNFKTIPILLPPLIEQRAIARALRTVQEAKEARQRELELERERKAALMQHLFTHGTRGEARKQTEIGEMPESWQILKLGEVFETQLGKMLSQKAKISDSPQPYMRNANVQWLRVSWDEVYKMDFTEKECEKFKLKYGDILVCEGGEVGRTAIWRDEISECYFQKAIHRLRSRSNNIIAEFFLYWMERAFRYTNLYGVAGTQTTIAHLPQDKLQAMKIPVPALEEQNQIVTVLISSDNKSQALQTEIERLDELFKAMLEELMTGKLSALNLIENE